jgi:hypothetical protein
MFVRDPSGVVIQGAARAATALADDVNRTCDLDVQRPTSERYLAVHGRRHATSSPGTIFLHGVVDRTGDVHVVQTLEPSLDEAAREALMRWPFLPATRKGEVAMVTSVETATLVARNLE